MLLSVAAACWRDMHDVATVSPRFDASVKNYLVMYSLRGNNWYNRRVMS